jgi:hypothetical protein
MSARCTYVYCGMLLFSLNTIVEFVVLHRCNYEADLERNELLKKADKYEKRFQNLTI